MRQLVAVAAIGLVVVACASAGPPTVTVSRIVGPTRVELGVAATVTFTVRRGSAPLAAKRATVRAALGAARVNARALRVARGRYAALLRFPAVGRWSLRAEVGRTGVALRRVSVVRPRLVEAYKVIVDPDGTLLVADGGLGGGRVIRIDPRTGHRVVVAGDGGTTFDAAGKDPTASSLGRVYSVARSPAGEVHALVDGRIVKLAGGRVRVVAGDGRIVSAGDGGPAARASLADATDIAFGPDGNLFVAELGSNRVRRIDAATGHISTLTQAIVRPFKLSFAHDGSLLVMQLQAGSVYRVDAAGGVSTFLRDVPVVSAVVALAPSAYLLSQHPPEHGAMGDLVRLDEGNRTTIASGTIREPSSLARGLGGEIYLTAFDPALPLGRVDPATGAVTPIR